MSMLAICIVLAITGQTMGAPVIQEAELAPPAGMSDGASAGQTTPRMPSSDLETVESTAPAPSTTTTVQELQWEYDEEGKPVARPAPASTPDAVKTPEPAPAPPSLHSRPSNSRRVQSPAGPSTWRPSGLYCRNRTSTMVVGR